MFPSHDRVVNLRDMFIMYFKQEVQNTEKLYYNFMGISKKEHPKWPGWKILSIYKEIGKDPRDVHDSVLDMLVENFYYIQYLEK